MKCCKSIRPLVIVLAILAAKLTLLPLIPLLGDRGFVVAVAIAQDGGDDEAAGDHAGEWGSGISENLCLLASFAKRVYLLSQLAAHEWNLAETAATLNNTLDELVKRMKMLGLAI